jgi:[ribosomal protein S5]-alanine N-acetyltransferase
MRYTDAPVVTGAPVRLRPVGIEDIADWYRYLAIPEVVEHTSWDLRSAADLKPMIEWYDASEPSSAIRFAIVPEDGGPLLGTIGFHTVSLAHRSAELAYDIAPEHWGRGIATACSRAVVDWGFAARGYQRIQATAVESNLASVRVLQKCGFALEGKLRNYRLVRGVARDFWMYARVADR